jgi:hypothetical protein
MLGLDRPLVSLVLALALLAAALSSCSDNDAAPGTSLESLASSDPAEHYTRLLALLDRGELARAYVTFLPPGYERDLDALFAAACSLITEEDFLAACHLLRRASAAYPSLASLPETLGLATYAEFERLDLRTLVSRLETSGIWKLVAGGTLRDTLGRARVRGLEVGEDFARLEVLSAAGDGRETRTELEVLKVDDRWVPASIARTWEKDVEETRAALEELAARKRKDPRLFLDQFDGAVPRIEEAAATVRRLLLASTVQ